jgi:signal transduction histidine kinase
MGNQNIVDYETMIKELNQQNVDLKAIINRQKSELESIIEQRTKELIDLIETKDKFFRIIAHELRNPFNSLLGFLNLLQENWKEYDIVKIDKFLTIIYRSTTVTYDLLVNLLDWLNSTNDKISFTPVKLNIFNLLSEEIINTSPNAEYKHITISNKIPENIYAFADKNMVKTIFRNLLNNAIKYTETNGDIFVFASEKEQFIEVTVKDTGIGITMEIIEKIFKIEGINSAQGTAEETGTGLGLLLCKEFVEIEGGKIWVESILGQGSEFKFTLPKTNGQYSGGNT